MLKLIAGIGKPTAGSVRVQGRVSALIELGAGFHPEISGRENVYINGLMLGLSRREIADRFDDIVRFAELERIYRRAGEELTRPACICALGLRLRSMSTPMYCLVDECSRSVMRRFTHKCLDKFARIPPPRPNDSARDAFAGLGSPRFCDQALWLDSGVVRAAGDPKRVIDAYLMDVARAENQEPRRRPKSQIPEFQIANPKRIRDPESQLPDSEPTDMFTAAEGRWESRRGSRSTAVETIGDERLPGASVQVGRARWTSGCMCGRTSASATLRLASASLMRMASAVTGTNTPHRGCLGGRTGR
jgi:ABC-type polysaccharide/polyol phosphate transport system ATPase subunit